MHDMAEPDALDLGVRADLEALLAALGRVEGLEILDIGCGEGRTARELAAAGARVTGFDPFIEGTEWAGHGSGSVRLLRAAADALPAGDRSADVVLFVFSLHHVPKAALPAALAEARRALKPSGRLVVAEPLARGAGHYVSAPFHDETAVRAAAAAALDAHAAPHFGSRRVLSYTDRRRWDGFESYAARMIRNMRFNGYTEEAVRSPEVLRRFDEMFAAGNGAFDQPVRIDVFSEPA
jgi:ubiquinone/menaquinone biosynthesis C-methylase UbiE